MAFLKQFSIIAAISCVGEGLRMLIPLPIPGSIYGLVIMLICLCTGIIRLDKVRSAATALIEMMPVLFIPSIVRLTEAWDVLSPVWLPVLGITVLTTFIVFFCAGRVTQAVLKRQEGGKADD